MSKHTEAWVEWISQSKVEEILARRAPDGLPKGASYWDYMEMEEALKERRFPNLGLAKAWAAKNHTLDMWGMPRIRVNQYPNNKRRSWECETIADIEYQGDGEFIDIAG